MTNKFNTDYEALSHHFFYSSEDGECYGQRMFCTSNRMYSYGHHFVIGQKVEGKQIVLVNYNSSSVTTSKQQRLFKNAIPYGWKVFEVENFWEYKPYEKDAHLKNVKDYFERIHAALYDSAKARSRKDEHLGTAETLRLELIDYLETFKTSYRLNKAEKELLADSLCDDSLLTIMNALETREKNAKAKKRKANKVAYSKALQNLELWKAGKIDSCYSSLIDGTFLRYDKDEQIVETSRSANAPIREAKILFTRIQQGKDVKGYKIGYYTVISVNGDIKIGCHAIDMKEVNRFAKSMDW